MTQRYSQASQCTGKRRFTTRRFARSARRRLYPGETLHIYRCPWCNGFHLGHTVPDHVRTQDPS